jgi:hypothetical protein
MNVFDGVSVLTSPVNHVPEPPDLLQAATAVLQTFRGEYWDRTHPRGKALAELRDAVDQHMLDAHELGGHPHDD